MLSVLIVKHSSVECYNRKCQGFVAKWCNLEEKVEKEEEEIDKSDQFLFHKNLNFECLHLLLIIGSSAALIISERIMIVSVHLL